MVDSSYVAQLRFGIIGSLSINQILNGTAQHLCKTEDSIYTGLVDILVFLFIHLDRSEADSGPFGQFGLGAAVGGSDVFEIGFCEALYHYGDSSQWVF